MTLVGHTNEVKAIAITPDGQRVISAAWDNTLKIWDLATGQILHTLIGRKHEVQSVAISQDGNYAVSASSDRTLKIWDIETGKALKR